jgi:hypothetical protein
MRGLLAKAKSYSARLRGGELLFDESGIAPEKRRSILEQIDRIVAESRAPLPASALTPVPKKKGILFPLIINASAILAIAAGLTAAFHFFQVRQEKLSLDTSSYFSAEGRLLDAFRRESEQKLQAKESEIADIQKQLSRLEREGQNLRSTMDARLKAREEALRAELKQSLVAEREKLTARGMRATEIEKRLQAIADTKKRQQDAEIESLRTQLAAELRRKEEELQKAKEAGLANLQKVDREKTQLMEEARRKETDLRSGFATERRTLQQQSDQAEKRLQEMADVRRKEQLISDQITGSYSRIIEEMNTSDFATAAAHLSELRSFLTSQSFEGLPALARRKPVDLSLVGALQVLASPSYASAVRAQEMLRMLQEDVKNADGLFAKGDIAGALKMYDGALTRIPAIQQALSAERRIGARRRAALVNAALENAQPLLQAGNIDAAVDEYKSLFSELTPEVKERIESVMESLRQAWLDRERAAVESLQAGWSTEEREMAAAQKDLEAKIERLSGFERSVLLASETYKADRQQAEEELSSAQPDVGRASTFLMGAFRTGAAKGLFPDLAAMFDRIMSSIAMSAGKAPATQPQEEPPAGTAGKDSGTRPEETAARGAPSAVTRFKLLGTVSSIARGQIVIEQLVTIAVKEGSRVQVRRMTESAAEVVVAAGIVDSVSGRKVTAKVQAVGEQTPLVLDAVYLAISEFSGEK